MLIKILEPNFTHSDERGTLVQLVRSGYSQVNLIYSVANSYRGGHYHRLNTESFYIINGRIKVVVSQDGISESYDFTNGDMFMIPPLVSHEFIYCEDSLLVGMYSLGVEFGNGEMDIISTEG